MAIVDDYAAIAAELRRLQAERAPDAAADAQRQRGRTGLVPRHPMRATPQGELLYRRLVAQGRR